MMTTRRKTIAFGVLAILALFLVLIAGRFVLKQTETVRGEEGETAAETVLEDPAETAGTDESGTVYFLKGHKMAGAGKRFPEALSQAGFLCKDLDLAETGAVPEDAYLLIICGPLTDLGEVEITALETYGAGGGDLMVFLDGDSGRLPNLETFLAGYGVSVQNGVLLDPGEGYFEEYETLILCDLYYSEMTKKIADLKKKYPMPMCRAFLLDGDGEGLRTEPVLQTSEEAYIYSYGETAKETVSGGKESGGHAGKYKAAAWIRKKAKEGTSDLVLFGSARMLAAADTVGPEDPWEDPVELLLEMVTYLSANEN